MTKDNQSYKDAMKEGFLLPITILKKLAPRNWNMFFIKLSLWIVLFTLIIEFHKYPNLNYPRIIIYLLIGMSAKLSWIIQLLGERR